MLILDLIVKLSRFLSSWAYSSQCFGNHVHYFIYCKSLK